MNGGKVIITNADKTGSFAINKFVDGSGLPFSTVVIGGVMKLQIPGGGIGGLTNVNWGNTYLVDSVYGNDGTGQADSVAFSFATIDGAMAAMLIAGTPGNIIVLPGSYTLATPILPIVSMGISCYPGVTISGTNIFEDVASFFKLTGFADIVDDSDIFNGAPLSNVLIECNSIICETASISGSDVLNINVYDYVEFTSTGFEFSGAVYAYINVPRILLNGIDSGNGIQLSNPDTASTIKIKADIYFGGTYDSVITYTKPTGIDFYFTFTGNIYVPSGVTINVAVIYAFECNSYPADPFSYGIEIRSNIYIDCDAIALLAFAGGYIKFFGSINISASSTQRAVVLNPNSVSIGKTSVVFLEDCDIIHNGTTDAIIYYTDDRGGIANDNFCQLKNVKAVSPLENISVLIESEDANSLYQVLAAYSNLGEGLKITNQIAQTTLITNSAISR